MLSKICTLACHMNCLPWTQQKTEGENLKENIPSSPATNAVCSLIHRWGKQADWVLWQHMWPTIARCLPQGEHLQNCGYLGPHLLAHSYRQQTRAAVLQEVKWSTTCMNSWGAAAGNYYSQWCIQRQWNILCFIHLSFSLRLYQRFSCLHSSDVLRGC